MEDVEEIQSDEVEQGPYGGGMNKEVEARIESLSKTEATGSVCCRFMCSGCWLFAQVDEGDGCSF